ncbi:hypothetical protein SY2F82_24640 [Streptomyces sp. Y2F8-2]|nr:hypothetical protein SY2F82_24640 [Streptomyces sp. Y2F8-2]
MVVEVAIRGLSGVFWVAFADGTNHRAPSRVPAAVAVSNVRRAVDDDRRAADTKFRSPWGAYELAVWSDASERRGSWESRGLSGPYAARHEHF